MFYSRRICNVLFKIHCRTVQSWHCECCMNCGGGLIFHCCVMCLITVVLSPPARPTRSDCAFPNYIASIEKTKVTTVNHSVKNPGTTFHGSTFTLQLSAFWFQKLIPCKAGAKELCVRTAWAPDLVVIQR